MKLSKQERIALIIIVVLVILAAGFFLLIKPKIDTINDTKSSLELKKSEYDQAVAKQSRKEGLRTDILKAYNDGKNIADMFFEELPSYEADKKIREFIEKSDANVIVESMEVSAPGTAMLSSYVYLPTQVEYALKNYVNQGEAAEAYLKDPRIVRQMTWSAGLGDPQTIGATEVRLKVKAADKAELLKFADQLNNYKSGSVRMAVSLQGLQFTDVEVDEKYEALIEAAKSKTEQNGNNNNPGEGAPAVTPNTPGNNDEDKEAPELYDETLIITFYSVERMQDPTAELNAQDTAV